MDNAAILPQKLTPPREPKKDHQLGLLEFELALDSAQPAANGFVECVGQVALSLNGALLFDLPASGLVENCQKIAAVHLPMGEEADGIAFALLSEDGTSVRVEAASAETADLARFAEAFMALHQRL